MFRRFMSTSQQVRDMVARRVGLSGDQCPGLVTGEAQVLRSRAGLVTHVYPGFVGRGETACGGP
eukprot:10504193-Alexandrium_andersonii.AAC.1